MISCDQQESPPSEIMTTAMATAANKVVPEVLMDVSRVSSERCGTSARGRVNRGRATARLERFLLDTSRNRHRDSIEHASELMLRAPTPRSKLEFCSRSNSGLLAPGETPPGSCDGLPSLHYFASSPVAAIDGCR